MRIVYFGSGAFGLPTLHVLTRSHEVALVVTQPDRPAGRQRKPAPTPAAKMAQEAGIPVCKPEDVNAPASTREIVAIGAQAFVVIAFGQKLGRQLLHDTFAVNLHASLLPKYRGAAPINWAIMNRETSTGLSVITLADRMDAGDILGQMVTNVDPMETAGELHDRLSLAGPDLMLEVLRHHEAGTLTRRVQDESQATFAPKLRKEQGTVSFRQPAERVRCVVHGLTPWPGCRTTLNGAELRLHRVLVATSTERLGIAPGTIVEEDEVACEPGSVRLLAVQPAGGKLMSFQAFRSGHAIPLGARLMPMGATI